MASSTAALSDRISFIVSTIISIPLPVLMSLFLGLVVVAVFATYLLVRLLAHFPRPPTLSETKYRTVGNDGISLHDLPDTSHRNSADKIALSVVVPAYNETERLPIMLDEALEYLNAKFPPTSSEGTWEILIVDDGSTDHTEDVALGWAEKRYVAGEIVDGQVRVCKLEMNRGKGGAVTHGMRHVRGDYIIFADADGASKFDELGKLLDNCKKIEKDGFAVAVGSRAHMVNSEAVIKRSFIRNLLMHGFHQFIRLVGIKHIADTQCGFKLFTRAAALSIFPYMHTERWIFDIEIFILASIMGIPVVECAISWHEVPGTKLNIITDSLNMAYDLLVLRGGYTYGIYKPGGRFESGAGSLKAAM